MKLLHHCCATNTEEGCNCGAAEANAYIAYLHRKIETLEVEREDPLFSITLYQDGTLSIGGHGCEDRLPNILRIIADSLEEGKTVLAVLREGQ